LVIFGPHIFDKFYPANRNRFLYLIATQFIRRKMTLKIMPKLVLKND
jgi:hypothetical protein